MKKILSLLAICMIAMTSAMADDTNVLPGKFSVSAAKKVQFTKSYLYWNGSAFKFEDNQTDFQSTWDANHVSHFYWSKTASVMYAKDYSDPDAKGPEYGEIVPGVEDLIDPGDAFFFCEANKDNEANKVEGTSGYYVLSAPEWQYLLSSRENASSLCKYGVTINVSPNNNVTCLIIAPDNYDFTTHPLSTYYTLDDANKAGFVCLPLAGYRNGESVINGYTKCFLWTASIYDNTRANRLQITTTGATYDTTLRKEGLSLRLVKDASLTPTEVLQSKINAGGTVTLDADLDLDATLTVPENTTVTLDLNGHVLNGAGITLPDLPDIEDFQARQVYCQSKASIIYNEGTLTIKDSNPTATHTQEGLTEIKGGVLTSGKGSLPNPSDGSTFGGAIYEARTASLTIEGGTITKNSAHEGAGIYFEPLGEDMNPEIKLNCKIIGNNANLTQRDSGGGICFSSAPNGSSYKLECGEDFEISRNTSTYSGAGIFASYCEVYLSNCKITGNNCKDTGGGLAVNYAKVIATDCTITDNTASKYGAGIAVTGLYNETDATVPALTFSGKTTVTGNTVDDKASNLFLCSNTLKLESGEVLIGGTPFVSFSNLDKTSSIGVHGVVSETVYNDEMDIISDVTNPWVGKFTMGDVTASDENYFFADDAANYKVAYNAGTGDEGGYLEILKKTTAINNVDANTSTNSAQAKGVIKTVNGIVKDGKKYNFAGQRVK